jgi:outer membrane protein assembly factor BamB
LLYVISHQGVLSCLEAKTGKVVWKNRVRGQYSASPIHAGDRIYFFNENAVCTVIRPGRKYEGLAVNRLNEQPLMASPAVAGNSFFIRTEKHLYRVEETTK